MERETTPSPSASEESTCVGLDEGPFVVALWNTDVVNTAEHYQGQTPPLAPVSPPARLTQLQMESLLLSNPVAAPTVDLSKPGVTLIRFPTRASVELIGRWIADNRPSYTALHRMAFHQPRLVSDSRQVFSNKDREMQSLDVFVCNL